MVVPFGYSVPLTNLFIILISLTNAVKRDEFVHILVQMQCLIASVTNLFSFCDFQ